MPGLSPRGGGRRNMSIKIINDDTGDIEVFEHGLRIICSRCGDMADTMFDECGLYLCPKCYFAPDRGM